MADLVPDISFANVVTHTVSNTNDSGYFVDLMKSVNDYVKKEFEQNRITGADYASVYLGAVQYALQYATQFALTKHINDQQAELLRAQVEGQEITNLELPAKTAAERRLMEIQRDLADYELNFIKPAEYTGQINDNNLKLKQIDLTVAKTAVEEKQLDVMDSQISLYGQQAQAFELKHKKDLAKVALDTYTVGVAQSVAMLDSSEVFGHNLLQMLEDAKWENSLDTLNGPSSLTP